MGDPAHPTDTDGDGVIDALEVGTAADDNTELGFLVPSSTASALGLPGLSGQPVIISAGGAQITSTAASGLPLSAESDYPADPGYDYPLGIYGFSVAAPAGTATVTIRFPAGTIFPSNVAVRKVDSRWHVAHLRRCGDRSRRRHGDAYAVG